MKYPIIFLSSFLLALFLFGESISFYFFQDDFFELNISNANNIREYLNFYAFRSDIIAYRPISLQNYFFIANNLFGLNPVGFRTIIFTIFFLSGFLIVKITFELFRSIKIGLMTAFLWLTSSIHFMSLTWIAASYNIIGIFFWLLTTLFFIKYTKSKKRKYYSLSIFAFVLCIGSFEFSITWPLIWALYYFLIKQKSTTFILKVFTPYILISAVYLMLRITYINVPQIPEYKIALNFDSLRAFFWYILWTFNIPEEFKKQIVSHLIYFNPVFLAEFWPLVVKSFAGFVLLIVLTITAPSFSVVNNKTRINYRLMLFLLIWFLVGISPVLAIPNHTFIMYLTLSSIAVYMLIAYLVVLSRRTFPIYACAIIWLFLSINALNFYRENSWMIEAQKVAKNTVLDLKKQLPKIPPSSTVLYDLPFSWQHQALSNQEAIKTIYSDPTLSIYYNKETLFKNFSKWNLKPVYIYLPDEK